MGCGRNGRAREGRGVLIGASVEATSARAERATAGASGADIDGR